MAAGGWNGWPPDRQNASDPQAARAPGGDTGFEGPQRRQRVGVAVQLEVGVVGMTVGGGHRRTNATADMTTDATVRARRRTTPGAARDR